jgi:hypothetical protein
VQRAAIGLAAPVDDRSLGRRLRSADDRERVQGRIELGDPGERCFRGRDRLEPSRVRLLDGLADAEQAEVVGHRVRLVGA